MQVEGIERDLGVTIINKHLQRVTVKQPESSSHHPHWKVVDASLMLKGNTALFSIAECQVNGRACVRVLIGCVRQNDTPPLKMSWSNPHSLSLCYITWQRTRFLVHWSWCNIVLHYPGRPNVINNKASIHWKRETEVRDSKMPQCWRKGPDHKPRECRWPQEVEKGRETDISLETPEGI